LVEVVTNLLLVRNRGLEGLDGSTHFLASYPIMRSYHLIVSVRVEYPALLSTVDCVGGCRIHPDPEGVRYSPRFCINPANRIAVPIIADIEITVTTDKNMNMQKSSKS